MGWYSSLCEAPCGPRAPKRKLAIQADLGAVTALCCAGRVECALLKKISRFFITGLENRDLIIPEIVIFFFIEFSNHIPGGEIAL